MQTIVFSLIIPHKNCPDLLQRCINSIPNREDLQVIVVDDNSDSDKVDFLSFPGLGKKNYEIIFIKESRGAGHARNIGISKAIGKWIMFADADDTFTNGISSVMDRYANDELTDLVILNARGIDYSNNPTWLRMNMYIDNYKKGRFYSEKVIRYGLWTPWSRMVKREIVEKNNILFEEIPTGNDRMFCLLCSKYAKRIAVENIKVYNYYLPVGRSLTDKYRKSLASLEPGIDLSFRITNLYKEVGYIFKPCHILARYRPDIDSQNRKEYIDKYSKILKKNNYSVFLDLLHFAIFSFGRFFRII